MGLPVCSVFHPISSRSNFSTLFHQHHRHCYHYWACSSSHLELSAGVLVIIHICYPFPKARRNHSPASLSKPDCYGHHKLTALSVPWPVYQSQVFPGRKFLSRVKCGILAYWSIPVRIGQVCKKEVNPGISESNTKRFPRHCAFCHLDRSQGKVQGEGFCRSAQSTLAITPGRIMKQARPTVPNPGVLQTNKIILRSLSNHHSKVAPPNPASSQNP